MYTLEEPNRYSLYVNCTVQVIAPFACTLPHHFIVAGPNRQGSYQRLEAVLGFSYTKMPLDMNPKKTTKLGNALHKAKESPVAEVAAQEEQQQENQKYPLPPSR